MRNHTKSWMTQLKMSTGSLKHLVIFAIAWLVAVVPAMTQAQGKPQQKQTANAAISAKAQSQPEDSDEQKAEARGGPHEGIKVHGHWVIEVHNPDGSFVSRTEFENSLSQNFASPFLAKVLARNASVGFWSIVLASNGGTQPCTASNPVLGTFPIPCSITEADDPLTPSNSPNLVVNGTATALQFSGSVTAAQNTTIGLVSTQVVQCGLTINPSASCANPATGTFTPRLLAQPVPVASGQIVQVTVTISFS